jgi:putative transposase
MRDLAVLFIHLITTISRLAGPGGARSVVAESVLVKQQLLILNRSRQRSALPILAGHSFHSLNSESR